MGANPGDWHPQACALVIAGINRIACFGPAQAPSYRGIGIRIEDDVIVTSGDPEVISAGVPKDADEIEALMARR
jgi:hypothetical protein